MPTNEEMLILKAATEGDLQLLKLVAAFNEERFQEKCESLRFEGLTALHIAAGEGKTQICKYLIESVKMNINITTTERGETPLLNAIMMDHLRTATHFIQQGADVNASDCDGATPLHIAVQKGQKKLMKLLISRGADIEAIHGDGTPLQAATLLGKKEVVKILLEHDANPNSAPPLSPTPLMMSMIAHSIGCLDMLLKAGADPNISEGGLCSLGSGNTIYEVFAEGWGQPSNVTNGRELKRKDYLNAMYCYTEAYYLDPSDAAVLSNRSLCWANMKDGKRALRDAKTCIQLKPDWPKAHYREGVAWTLLKNYSMASEAFSKALRLDPENKEILKAFKEAVEAGFGMSLAGDIRALHI